MAGDAQFAFDLRDLVRDALCQVDVSANAAVFDTLSGGIHGSLEDCHGFSRRFLTT